MLLERIAFGGRDNTGVFGPLALGGAALVAVWGAYADAPLGDGVCRHVRQYGLFRVDLLRVALMEIFQLLHEAWVVGVNAGGVLSLVVEDDRLAFLRGQPHADPSLKSKP